MSEFSSFLDLARQLMAPVLDAVVCLDAGQRVVLMNPAAESLAGVPEAEALGLSGAAVLHLGEAPEGAWMPGTQRLLTRHDGSQVVVELSQHALLDSQGEVWGWQWVLRDVSDQFSFAATLSHLGSHDPLTGLINRQTLMDRLEQSLAIAQRYERLAGFVVVRIDDLAAIRTMLGQELTDQLLIETSQRLSQVLRRSDTVGRLDDDSFGLLLPEVNGEQHGHRVADKVLALCLEPIDLYGQPFRVPLRVGVSCYPSDGLTGSDLLRQAQQIAGSNA